MPITLDFTNALSRQAGRAGLRASELTRLGLPVTEAVRSLRNRFEAGNLGFAELPERREMVADVRAYAKSVGHVDNVVVLGIGGSALGPRAVYSAIRGEYANVFRGARNKQPRLIVVDNVDPEPIAQLFGQLDPKRTVINVITKSGSTAETMAGLLYAEQFMREGLGRKRSRQRIVATTDPEAGDLRRIAIEEGYRTFDIPSNVGGRFSVLTPVGLLPLALVGIDIEALMSGAGEMTARCWSERLEENPAAMAAALEYLLDTRRGKKIQVIFPYTNALVGMAAWYCQLWAESLGKAEDRRGRRVNVGQTPVVALGATDQHSQLQLYMEGPDDKTFAFWVVDEYRATVTMPARWDLESTGYLGGQTFNKLIAAEQRAVELALTKAGRPSVTYRLRRVDERVLGALITLLEFQTAIAGELYDINAFDQPGVEAGKRATYALMGRKGYGRLARAIERREARLKRVRV